jgi:hypothetical protein
MAGSFGCVGVTITILTTYIVTVSIIAFDFRSYTISPTHPCLLIDTINTSLSDARITFTSKLTLFNPNLISSYFGFWTSAFDLPLLMPTGSARNPTLSNLTLHISFPFPFITDYTGDLFCVDTNIYQNPPFQLPEYNKTGIVRSFPANFSVPAFRDDFPDSQLLCHENRSETRWCEARHIGIASGHFIMQTPAHFHFPNSFLSLGSRGPLFDDPREQISNEPVLTSKRLVEMSAGVGTENEIAIFGSLGPAKQSVSGAILDFLIPGLMTLDALDIRGKKLRWFASGMEHCPCLHVIRALTGNVPSRFPSRHDLTIFEHVVLGLAKVDALADSTRPEQEAYVHKYRIPRGVARRLQERVLKHLDIPGEANETVVTFFDMSDMPIANIRELSQLVSRTCPFCTVQIFEMDKAVVSRLIAQVARTTVLIARSGIGLEHAVWLPRNASVLELRPFGFWCDDTPKVVARAAEVKHYQVTSAGGIPVGEKDETRKMNVQKCRSAASYCASHECYATLLQQPSIFEWHVFNQTWDRILQKLKKARSQ